MIRAGLDVVYLVVTICAAGPQGGLDPDRCLMHVEPMPGATMLQCEGPAGMLEAQAILASARNRFPLAGLEFAKPHFCRGEEV